MKPLVILGAGGHAKMIISTAEAAGFKVGEVYDDEPSRWGKHILGAEVAGPLEDARQHRATPAFIAIGDGQVRSRIANSFELNWTALVHPFAYVDPTAILGEGTVIAAGAVVQANAVVGRHSVINTGATVDHDCELGDFVTLGPGVHLAGGVSVACGSMLGVGCCVRPGCSIGAGAIVGAGAAVVSNLPADVVAYGVPARVQGYRTQSGAAA